MANVTLKTQILNKYNNNLTADYVLGKGEINFVEVDIPLGNGKLGKAVLLKVGDGESSYESLDFVAAKAADVYAWAKEANKPGYEANEIAGLSEFIAKEIQDTNTTYSFEEVDGTLVIKSKNLNTEQEEVLTLDFVSPTELGIILSGYTSTNVFNTFKTEVKNNFSETNASIDVIEADYLKSSDKAELNASINEVSSVANTAKAAIDAFLLEADATEKAVDTLKEIQTELDKGVANAASILAEVQALKDENHASKTELTSTKEELLSTISTAKSEAIAAASADATSKADAAEAQAKAEAKTLADAALNSAKEYANSLNHEDTKYEAGEGLVLNIIDGKNVFSINTDLTFILDGNVN